MKSMKIVSLLISALVTLGHARYIGSYTARLGYEDHYNSRGLPLGSVADILQQDRANYHRYGIRDPEDTGDSYFINRYRRSRMKRMLRRGEVDPTIVSEILNETPVVKVNIYSNYIEVSRGQPLTTNVNRYIPESFDTLHSFQTIEEIKTDALKRAEAIKYDSTFSFDFKKEYRLKHEVLEVFRCKEQNITKALVLLTTNAASLRINHAHSSGVALSAFLYALSTSGWVLESYKFGLKGSPFFGTWGYPPEKKDISIVPLAEDHCSLAIRWLVSSGGEGDISYSIVTHRFNSFYVVFNTSIESDNTFSGSSSITSWKTIIHFQDFGSSEYRDIVLHRYGKVHNHNIDYKVHFRFDPFENIYRALGKDPLVETTN